MYMQTHSGLGRLATPSLAAPPRSAEDALALRQAAKLAKVIHAAVQQLGQSVTFLATPAQKDLLREIVAILGVFFPAGFGVMNKSGKTRIGVSQQLVPMQFLRDYFRNYWLSDPKDRAALRTKDADGVFATMEADLLKLVAAVETHAGP